MGKKSVSQLKFHPQESFATNTPRASMREVPAHAIHYLSKSVPVVVDYFCGAGGFTCGALQAGAIVVCGIDCDKRAEPTYTRNNKNPDGKEVPFIHSYVDQLSPETIKRYLAPYFRHPTIFVGCPPCQPFTNLRTIKNRSDKEANALLSFVLHVDTIRPEFVIVENVPGIRAKKYGDVWDASIEALRAAGYQIRSEVVNAARFGVPQKRNRMLLVASRVGIPPWPTPMYEPEKYRTVQDVLGNAALPSLEAGEISIMDPMHAAAKLSEKNLRRIRAIKDAGGSRTDWTSDLYLSCYNDHDGHTDVYGRMAWDKPAPTLTTRFVSLSNGRFGHPVEDRAITPREGALLQTFPPDYQFLDLSRDMNVLHIGNAVPPSLAEQFIGAIMHGCSTEVDHG